MKDNDIAENNNLSGEPSAAESAVPGGLSGKSFCRYKAEDVLSDTPFAPDKRRIVLVTGISSGEVSERLAAVLSDAYGGDTEILLTRDGRETVRVPISELAKRPLPADGASAVLLPETFLTARRHDLHDLLAILRRLLAPDGCPWDRAQTHRSIEKNLIEETYELADAVERGDVPGMVEECGDVLLQVAFHCLMAENEGLFDLADVLTALCTKLISRHTHVFGDRKAADAAEALDRWNEAKKAEKGYVSFSDAMDRIPANMPSLLYAYKLQKSAGKSGFDWPSAEGALEKLAEEAEEFRNAPDGDAAFEEAGDLLFTAVNCVRKRGIEPETAMRAACLKFRERFAETERGAAENGEDFSDEAVREKYWEKAKETRG